MPDEISNCFQCGRENRPHCPDCGSYRCYALARRTDTVSRADGQLAHLRVYRCLHCARIYNEDDWQLRCQAAPERRGRVPKATGKNVVFNRAVPDFDPAGVMAAMEEIKRKRGL